jgi:hypothetical protein
VSPKFLAKNNPSGMKSHDLRSKHHFPVIELFQRDWNSGYIICKPLMTIVDVHIWVYYYYNNPPLSKIFIERKYGNKNTSTKTLNVLE